MGNEQVMNAQEAADFLHISYDLLKKKAARGEIPRHAVSERNYVYLRSELLDWIASRPDNGLLLDRV